MLDTFIVPEAFGTTTCEYSVGCTRQTNVVAYIPTVGHIPMCKVHIHFYNTH